MGERISRAVDAVASAVVIGLYVGLPVFAMTGVQSGLLAGAMAALGSIMQTYNLQAPVARSTKSLTTTMMGR